ncbi:MAG: hypothetical protein Q7J08_02355 [Methanocorpusculum sp.]|jgi:KaiC/GvpD/RAD55 family RecA-like ATPase|uniref:RAD55 family ATPase n=1 Tax=Methanocorpusculum sp. TaxID=2058474 RepID=UPI0027235C4B|nr:hypothetical protein [Methanocorpusculum sp.]MDO9522536.1 hypothetical protein [Methanocorpusculum sp.]
MSDDHTMVRVPTYIPSVDKILGGGVPTGSTIILFTEPGAGGPEFLFTSLVNYCREIMGDYQITKHAMQPAAIYYITPKTSRGQFVEMMKQQFSYLNSIDFEGEILDKRVFHMDMGDVYFARSIVPLSWYSQKTISEHLRNLPPYDDYGGLAYLAGMVETAPENSMVFIDSLTPYLPYFSDSEKWQNLVFLIYGLSRAAKKRKITFVILLTTGILPENREIALGNAFDAIIRLAWQKSQESMSRQRQMYIEKFAGVLPMLSSRDIATYNVSISPETGFEISNLRRVA